MASVASMIDQFNMDNIKILQQLGYQVDVACNFLEGNTCSNEKIQNLKETLNLLSVNYYQIDFTRNVTNIKRDIIAYQQLKKVISENKYNFIHCHSPIGGAIGRIIAYVAKTKVIYTAHGFHFYSGAPIKNWMIYYPIEKALSHYTDILITITLEDYDRARKKLRAKKTRYIPGIGVDTKKFQRSDSIRKEVREELGLCYTIYSYMQPYLGVGTMNIYTGLSNKYCDKAISVINEQLQKFAREGISNELLEINK